MKIEKFKVPGLYGEEYIVRVIDVGEFQQYSPFRLETLYFCMTEEHHRTYQSLVVHLYKDSFKKTCYSDVVVQKIDDKFVVIKNRYGFNSSEELTILGTPIYENH